MGTHVRSDDPAKAEAVRRLKALAGGTKVTMVARELDGSYSGDVMRSKDGGGFERLGRFSVRLDDLSGTPPASVSEVDEEPESSDPATERWPRVGIGQGGHTAIILRREGKLVYFIPMEATGIAVRKMPAEGRTKVVDGEQVLIPGIDDLYPPDEGYDVRSAARTYVKSGADLGITRDALEELEKLTPVTERERQKMEEIAARRLARFAAINRKGTIMTENGKSTKTAAAPKAPKEPRESASALFQSLIMEGKLTDSEIFAEVQEKFNLDDSRRSYVAWYRNHLKKKGKNPPEKKPEPEDEEKAAKKADEAKAPATKAPAKGPAPKAAPARK